MVWNAAHSEGLIVESFSVPPDLTARGLNGQAVASQLLDDLSAMQSATTLDLTPSEKAELQKQSANHI